MNGGLTLRSKSFHHLKHEAESSGFELLSTLDGYKSRKPALFKCSVGHEFTRMPQAFHKLKTCPLCSTTGVVRPLSTLLTRPEFCGMKVEGDYKNQLSIMRITCPSGHVFERNLKHFTGCHLCAKACKSSGTALQDSIESNGFKALGEIPKLVFYDGDKHGQKFKVACPSGHEFTTNYRNWFEHGYRCPKCAIARNTSAGENEIAEWLRSEGYVVEHGYGVLDGKNVDVYIPDMKFGIEFNGIYHHTKYPPSYHFSKHQAAIKNNITLLSFWEDEWYATPAILKSMILAKLRSTKIERIAARKTTVVKLKPETALEFFTRNHLQGPPSSLQNCIGLLHGSKIVMAVAIGRHHRNNNQIALTRMAPALMTTVVGGFAKLLKQLPRPLLTWSDNRISLGETYKKHGFILESHLPPDYCYVKGGKRFSKQSMRKTEEEKTGDLTELELRTEQGYHRLYDAGKIAWVLEGN